MRYLKRYEDLDFSGYIPEETRYKEVQNIVKDILIDLDEYPSIEWSIEELKSKYFPNVYVANCYDCVADLTITYVGHKSYIGKDKQRLIIERLIEVLNMEGFTVFEHTAAGNSKSSPQDMITNSTESRFVQPNGDIYKTFKICLTKSLKAIDNYRKE